jgi:type I restriction enzyme M protein
LRYVREWILRYLRIVASIDLHPDTFQPRNGTQTSVLLLQRKSEDEIRREERQGHLNDYEIFMAQVRAIGHDKRGNTTYFRNEDGEIVLTPKVPGKTTLLERTASGEATVRPQGQSKIVDDDTPLIATEFLEWQKQAAPGW